MDPTKLSITRLEAHALSAAIHAKQVSCREVMQAYLSRIAELNPVYNAIVNLQDGDELLRQADARDAQLAQGVSMGWMHGMPQAIKDLSHSAGIATTMGLQIIGRPQADFAVLQLAQAYEQAAQDLLQIAPIQHAR